MLVRRREVTVRWRKHLNQKLDRADQAVLAALTQMLPTIYADGSAGDGGMSRNCAEPKPADIMSLQRLHQRFWILAQGAQAKPFLRDTLPGLEQLHGGRA